MYHFIMRKYQHEFLAVGIDHAEGKFSVMVASEIRIVFDIIQIIVHESHIPLQIKTESSLLQGTGDQGECRTFLCNGQYPRISLF